MQIVLAAFDQQKNVKLKSSPADLVTETDQQVEKTLISAIRNKYPRHRFCCRNTQSGCDRTAGRKLAGVSLISRFIGEESVAAGERLQLTDCPTWIIDPIDGTVNFVHR